MVQHLNISSFFSVWSQYQGLIPVSIDGDKVVWQDVSKYHFYEGFFYKSLNNLALVRKGSVKKYSTDIELLKDDRIVENSLPIAGFVFHMGRCGSTLLTKVLGSSRDNHIISEAYPLNKIFTVFTNYGASNVDAKLENYTIYKNLLLALARKRVDTHERCFVKFSSYNIHFIEFIQTVFPDVPTIFVTRDVTDVVSSFNKKPSAWMQEDNLNEIKTVFGLQGTEIGEVVMGFEEIAKNASIKMLDYNELKPENILDICSLFNYIPKNPDLDKMRQQFLFDSKVEFNKKQFKR